MAFLIIKPYRSTTYVDAAYCYRPSSVVCLPVGLSVCLSQLWAMQKRLNRSRCRVSYALRWAQGTMY